MRGSEVMQQILLITDGCSNEGADPVKVALFATRQGIPINVIGVLDDGVLGEKGEREVIGIAVAGNGMYRFTKASELSKTVQMMTQHTMEISVQRSMSSRWGMNEFQSVVSLPPELRPSVAREVENAVEFAFLEVCLVIDLSGSMNPKRSYVVEAVRDLVHTLSSRSGRFQLDTIVFPDANGGIVRHLKVPATRLADAIGKIDPQGNTPTGPALALAIQTLKSGALKNTHQDGSRVYAG